MSQNSAARTSLTKALRMDAIEVHQLTDRHHPNAAENGCFLAKDRVQPDTIAVTCESTGHLPRRDPES